MNLHSLSLTQEMLNAYHTKMAAPSALAQEAGKSVALPLRNAEGVLDVAFSPDTLRAELLALEAAHKYPRGRAASGGLDMGQLAAVVQQHQSQTAKINQLPPGPWTGERVSLAFSQLTSALDSLPGLIQQAANAEIITRSLNWEAIWAYLVIFFWYDDAGPSLATSLCAQYEENDAASVISAHPGVGGLIDHLFKYANFVRHYKDGTSTAPGDELVQLQHLPANLYGLVPSSACTTKLPDPAKIPKASRAISNWVYRTFLEIISRDVIVPSVRNLDAHLSIDRPTGSTKRSNTYDNIRARLVITGATISRVVQRFQNDDSILASLLVQKLVLRPTQLFDLTRQRETAIEFKILQDPDAVFQHWDAFLAATFLESDELPGIAGQIADIMWERLTTITSAQKPSKLKSRPAAFFAPKRVQSSTPLIRVNIVDPVLSVDTLLVNERPFYAMAAIVLHDVLAKRRHQPFHSDYLARIMKGLRPTGGAKPPSDYDADHCNPIRYNNLNTQLLRECLPPQYLTTELGISALLVWMTTGQGNMTSQFAYRNNMCFPDLATCVSVFELAHSAREKCTNSKIWGKAPCNWMNLTHAKYPTAEDKFAPMFARKLQARWIDHLGHLANRDPATYRGRRMSWSSMINWMQKQGINCLKGYSLTLLQFGNNMALLGLCMEPTPEEMADFLAQVGGGGPPKKRKTSTRRKKSGDEEGGDDKGGFKGLLLLGYQLKQRQTVGPWIKAAFLSFYHHLDKHLSDADKEELHFGAMFVEHLLCKISRFQSMFVNDAGARNVSLETIGRDALRKGFDNTPIPLEGDRDDVKRAIDSILVSFSFIFSAESNTDRSEPNSPKTSKPSE